MFNNVDSTSVDININGKDKTIPPDYWYTLSASIAILNVKIKRFLLIIGIH